jgi:hypothetical protein
MVSLKNHLRMKNEQAIRVFFDEYAKRFNAFLVAGKIDIEGTVNSFAPFFVESSPVGINGGKNDQTFQDNLIKGYGFYKSIGTKSMRVDSLSLQPLDEFHWLATVHWVSVYEKDGSEIIIPFQVLYMLRSRDGDIKIFAYITGDEQAVLKAHGLLAEK